MRRYSIQSDDDGHWYIVPNEQLGEFYNYIDYPDVLKLPEGVVEINGHPNRVSFDEWSM